MKGFAVRRLMMLDHLIFFVEVIVPLLEATAHHMDGRVSMMNRSPEGKGAAGQEGPRPGEPGSTTPDG
eukprot:8933522-Karenia_brevis.AAC.1